MNKREVKEQFGKIRKKLDNLIDMEEQNELENGRRMKLQCDALKSSLELMTQENQRMRDDLQQKELMINEKEVIISRQDVKLKDQAEKIVELDEMLESKDSIISKVSLKNFSLQNKSLL
jgi:hypothetical protein